MASRKSEGPILSSTKGLPPLPNPFPNFNYGSPSIITKPPRVSASAKKVTKTKTTSIADLIAHIENSNSNTEDVTINATRKTPKRTEGVRKNSKKTTKIAGRRSTETQGEPPNQESQPDPPPSREHDEVSDVDVIIEPINQPTQGKPAPAREPSVDSNVNSDVIRPILGDNVHIDQSLQPDVNAKSATDHLSIFTLLFRNLILPLRFGILSKLWLPIQILADTTLDVFAGFWYLTFSPYPYLFVGSALVFYSIYGPLLSQIRERSSSLDIGHMFNAHQGYQAPSTYIPLASEDSKKEFEKLAVAVESISSEVLHQRQSMASMENLVKHYSSQFQSQKIINQQFTESMEKAADATRTSLENARKTMESVLDWQRKTNMNADAVVAEVLSNIEKRLPDKISGILNSENGKIEIPQELRREIIKIANDAVSGSTSPPSNGWVDFIHANEGRLKSLFSGSLDELVKTKKVVVSKDMMVDIVKSELEPHLALLRRELESRAKAMRKSQQDSIASVIQLFKPSKPTGSVADAISSRLADFYTQPIVSEPDFALRGIGATVDPSFTSPSKVFGSWLWRRYKEPAVAIDQDNTVGNCWAISGVSGNLQINLARTIVPTSVTLEHVPWSSSIDHDVAPKDFEFWTKIDDDEQASFIGSLLENHHVMSNEELAGISGRHLKGWLRLGRFVFNYSPKESHMNQYKIPDTIVDAMRDNKIAVQDVMFRFVSNHGNPSHTCVYRVRVHGREVAI